MFDGREIIPIRFLKAVLPDPGELGENYKGWTSIGCRIRGIKNGKGKTYYIYNNCSMKKPIRKQDPRLLVILPCSAAIGAMMYLKGIWKKPVFSTSKV